LKDWIKWTGDSIPWSGGTNNVLDAFLDRPAQDRLLFDTFTAAINENATRGQLSVNQTNLAAWSAVLSGVIVISNNVDNGTATNVIVIPPAGIYNPFLPLVSPGGGLVQTNPLVRIWQGINATRANFFLFPNRVFNHLGDVLAAPQLTEQSPFLNFSRMQYADAGGVSDEMVERIPQQIMGLLTLEHTPRLVIYSYGQALHPAEQSIYAVSGAFFGLCTNYQVTAETATRAVVRVEGTFDPRYTNNPAGPPFADSFGRVYPPRLVVEQFNVLPPD
jgi:hypothetical protein